TAVKKLPMAFAGAAILFAALFLILARSRAGARAAASTAFRLKALLRPRIKNNAAKRIAAPANAIGSFLTAVAVRRFSRAPNH
ncbi:MAG: hypothetical protein AAFW68_12805, partial [Pseudomonadota bacterium]